tara:strand:+ start:71 stop:508 length:438 start_codon:yes stop_codon:yes gene_type:complete
LKSLFKKVCIASDHAGFNLKNDIKNLLIDKDISIIDLGPLSDKAVDYPDFAKKVSKRVKSGNSDIGILVCGTGTGMAITANKTKGIRAAVCYNVKSTKMSRQHNNANVISLGARLISKKNAFKLVSVFLETKFEGGRHLRRVRKI